MDKIEKLLEDLRKRLVETGTRNRLVHVNRKNKRAKAIPIIDERSEDIFEILRIKKTRMQFAAKGSEEDEDASNLRLASNEETIDESRFTDKFLDTPFAPDTLQKKLLRIARDAQTAEEEQGINILYLAMGFLKWFEDTNSNNAREAPLILIPVDLIRNKRTSSFYISVRDEDIVANLPLQERLLNDFGVQIPEINDDTDWLPKEYFQKVSEAIKSQTRWSIDVDGMQVGFFSFAKLLMLKDLDPQNWSSGSLLENPIIRGLLVDGFKTEPPLYPKDANLDEVLKFEDLLHVIDADASQTKVIQEVRSGRNLVVQGPPGTGKSQTITNILSAAAYDGMKILFVAEKMAALDVVHRRMSNLGLEDLCIELHSRNANKRSFLEELARTLSNKKETSVELEDTNLHIETRDKLNKISKALHQNVKNADYTPFEILSKLIKFSGDETPLPTLRSPVLGKMTTAVENDVLKVIDEFRTLHSDRKNFRDHPFRSVLNLELQPTDLARVIKETGKAVETIEKLRVNVQWASQKCRLECPENLAQINDLAKFVSVINNAPTTDESTWKTCLLELSNKKFGFPKDIQRAIDWVETMSKVEEVFFKDVWSADLHRMRREIETGIHGLFYRIFGPYRKRSKELASVSKGEIPRNAKDRLELVDKLLSAKEKKKSFENDRSYLAKKIGENWREEETDFASLLSCWEWLVSAGDLVTRFSVAELVTIISEFRNPLEDIEGMITTDDAETKIDKISKILKIDHFCQPQLNGLSLEEICRELTAIFENEHLYHEWVLYSGKRRRLEELGLEELIKAIDEERISVDQIRSEFLYALNETRWKKIIESHPEIAHISKLDRHEIVHRFKNYEESRIAETCTLIREKHLSQLPTGAVGEMAFLRGEIAKKKRHKPIRQVMKHAAGIVQRIKPVFLMSPVSVAQFLPPETLEFDMLVIDEASQVKPEDAIGAVARAKQIVVVGDKKQLPPTTFFDRLTDNESDQDELDDDTPVVTAGEMESILTLCDARGFSNSMLRWHYRSRDPSLIACSNDEFYDNNLILPPSPSANDSLSGMSFHRVPGVYTSASKGIGRRGTNQIEAEKIADRLHEIARERPDYSVGIGTFSKTQADMITEVLELRRRSDPNLDYALSKDAVEPTFIKNIENIQGDERDIILISVGYGPHEPNGRLASMNFGPVNAEGGERRLNVLFSRARIACEIYCSFDPGDIDLKRSKKYGTEVFKKYLDFAKTGNLPHQPDEGKEPDSEFEADVANVIRSIGYEVSYQVGSVGFKIDLGVKSKTNPNHYILAVECDGATYHSALWARERDRLRQEVLESFGWRFHRIWSTDWFYSRHSEIERLKTVLENSGELVLGEFLKGANAGQLDEEKPSEQTVEKETILLTPEYKIPNYIKADISQGMLSNVEPHAMPLWRLKDFLAQIVEIEGIIHIDEIARRYTNAMGKTRVGSRILETVKKAMKSVQKDCDFTKAGDFWGTKEQFKTPPVRNRSNETAPLTKPEYLSGAEIIAAAELIERDSGTVDIDDLIRTISRLLGYKRAGPDFRRRVTQVLKSRS
ncbi:MAG: DUF3320 domain-containing protein [Parvularculales bacterium]